MKYDKNIQLINDLVNLAEIIEIPFNKKDVPCKFFGIGKSNISFTGFDNVSLYQDTIETLFRFNKDIAETWTLKTFEEALSNLIRFLKNNNSKCSSDDIIKFYDYFNNAELIESEILYELLGAEISSDKINFGDFNIYNYDLSIDYLTEKYSGLIHKDLYFSHRQSNVFLGIKVKARENSKAVEIGNKLCESFENVINYMMADLKHQHSVGVFNYRGWHNFSTVVCNNQSMGFHGSKQIALPVNIEDSFFKDSSRGNDKIWDLITKSNKTEIEKRILNSIEWIGKAINELDLSKSLVQFVFSIEGMLQYNEKTIITPSIVSQISDWIAFIIHDDSEQRKKIATYFKDIYKKRSAVAHGAMKIIDIQDLHLAMQLSKLMVISFLTKTPFNEMKTMEELNTYLNDLKFK